MSTSNDTSKKPADLKTQASDAVRVVSDQLNDQANLLRETAADVRYNTQEFIQNNPWQSVIMAAGVGFLVGVIIARR
jgi:ElaB/YqjD/DUF883 family membrane-anchored ribosome-binding protein